jgi:hypothetical protein
MMHYLRIVNAGGRQKWHGHDHKDKAHPTLLFGVTLGALINWARAVRRYPSISGRRFILAPA